MKEILLIGLMLTGFYGSAQIVKNVGDFHEVKVFDRISVQLVESGENKVEINGKRSKDVEVVNNNGELKIRMTLEKLLKGEEIDATVYYTRLKNIEAGQGSFVGSSGPVKATSLDVNAKEGAEIKLNLDVTEVEVRAVTGGIVTLSGTATEVEANLGTGGILNAKSLEAMSADVSINAGGEATVYATKLVEADIKAGGTVTYYGDPEKVEEKTTLGGTIRKGN